MISLKAKSIFGFIKNPDVFVLFEVSVCFGSPFFFFVVSFLPLFPVSFQILRSPKERVVRYDAGLLSGEDTKME